MSYFVVLLPFSVLTNPILFLSPGAVTVLAFRELFDILPLNLDVGNFDYWKDFVFVGKQ